MVHPVIRPLTHQWTCQAPGARRSATEGWCRTAATADIARAAGRDMVFLDGDAFSDAMKDRVADLLQERFAGRLDYLVYSVAAPRPGLVPERGATPVRLRRARRRLRRPHRHRRPLAPAHALIPYRSVRAGRGAPWRWRLGSCDRIGTGAAGCPPRGPASGAAPAARIGSVP